VLTVDGPAASGKGTLAAALAQRLGYHLLDSGAIYRAAGVAAQRAGVDLDDALAVAAVARALELRFDGERVLIGGQDLSEAVRSEQGGQLASRVSAHPEVRVALHALQLSFRRVPGLVADGRDMGTVVFPDAPLKVFLTASAAERALRRQKQLAARGIDARIADLRADLEARDLRDSTRATAPLKPAEDALSLDNSGLGIDESVDRVLGWWAQRRPF
jgi:3-phosphoshikimate 1-carboxyvinyltransferase